MNLATKLALLLVAFSLSILLLVGSAQEGNHHSGFVIAIGLVFLLGYLLGDTLIREKGSLGRALVDLAWTTFGGASALGAAAALVFGAQSGLAGGVFLSLSLVLATSLRLSKSVHDVLDQGR